MASEQTVKIPISLEVIDSSVQNIKDILGKMKPDSAGFRQLSKIMDDLVKSSGKIQASFERGFSSNSEIKAAEKEIRNVEAAMESLNKLSGSISFKDLKLDTNQQKTFDKLEQDLNIAKQHYNDLLKSFGSKENSALIQLVDKDLALRSFDEIQTALTSKVHEMESSAQGLQSIFTKLSEQVNKITEAQKNGSYKQGDAIKNIIGEDAYKDFFLDTQRGISFKGTKAGGKGGAKEAFIEYLKSSFSLTEADLGDIRGAVSAKDLERIFSDGNIISGLTNKISTNLGNGNNLVAQLRNLLNQVNSVGLEMNGAGTALDAFKAKIMSSANVSPELAQALTLVVSKMQELRGNADGAGESLQRMNKQAQMVSNIKSMAERFLGLYQIIGFIKQGFREMTTTIKELDSVMNGISVVTKMSTSDLWGQVDVYSQMAQQYGTSIKGAYEVSRIYYQQGLETKDVMALTEETLKLSKISGLDYATTTDYMTTALRGFKMEMTDASKVVDVYSNLAANTAVSQQELAEAMTRTASSMESVGATFEETSAMIATMVAVTRESASNIGSAMKSIGSRYGELTKDPTKLVDAEGEQMDFNKVDTALRSIGISMHTADGQFRDFTEVILELADAWKTLDSTQQRYVATQFAGNRQQSRFLALVSNGDLLKQNLQVAKNSEDVGTTQALKTLDSIETKINQVTTAWQQFYLNIGLENVWKGALDGITNILNTLNELPKVFGKFPLVAIGAVGNAITLIRSLIDNALTSFSRILPQTAQQVGTEVGTNLGRNMELTWTQSFENIRNKLNVLKADSSLQKQVNPQFLSEAQNSVTKIATALNTVTSLASLFALSMNDGSRSAEVMSGIISGIAGLLQTVGGVFLTFFTGGTGTAVGIPMMLSGLSSMIGGISLLDETIEERVARLTKEAQQLTNIAKQSKSDEKSLENSINKYRELEKSQYESEEAAENFKEISNELAQQFPSLITSLDAVGNATIDATQLDNVLAEARRRSAEATLEAAQAEREKAQADVDKAKNDIKTEREQLYQTANAAVRTSTYQSGYKDQAAYDEIDLQYNIGAAKSDQNYIIRLANTYLEDYTLSSLEEVENHLINGDFDGSDDVKNFIAGYFDSLEYAGAQLDAILSDETATPEAIMAIANNYAKIFRKKAAVERDLWQTGNIWYLLYDKIDKWNNTNQKLEQVQGALSNAEFNELNSNIDKTITNSGVSSVIGTLGKNQIISDYKAAKEKGLPSDMTPSKWYEQLEKNAVLELQEATKGKFTEQQLADLDKYLKDTKHYGSSLELRKALDLTDEKYDVLDTYLTNYYKDISKNYHDLAKGAIETANKKRDNERSQFFTSFKDIVTDNNDEVNSYLEQSTINGLLEYEKVIVKTASGKELSDAGTKAKAVVEQIDQIEEGLADQISSNGFSREGLQKSIKALQATEAYNDVNSIERNLANNLEFLYSLLPDNISLTIQSQIDSASQVIDDITGYASKAVSGVSSMEDAQKMIAFFKSYLPDENISINNLQYSNKKFTLSNAKELLPQLIAAAKNKLAADNKVLNDVNSQIGEDNSNINTFIAQLEDDNAEAKRVLASIDQGLYNEYFDDQGKLKKGASFDKDSIIDAVKKRREEATQLEKNTSILDILLEDIKAEAATVGSVMKEIAANPTKISRDTAGKLKGLNEDLYGQLTEDIYGNYFITYADLIRALERNDEIKNSMSLSDRNTLINQTKEAQRKASRQSAIENIAKNFDAVTGDMLVAWANAVGVDINEIQSKFTQNGNGYWEYNSGDVQDFLAAEGLADSEVAQKAIGDSLINQEKAVKDFYSSMITSITKGEQRIEKNARTEAIVKDLTDSGYDIAEKYGYYIVNLSKNSIQSLIAQVTNDSTLADADRTELLTSLNNTLKTYSFQEIFTDTLTNYAALTYEQADKLVKGMSNELGVETSLDKLIEEGILSYNTFTGTYEANLNKLIALYDTLEQLGIDQNQDAANTIRAKILQLQHDTSWTTVVENFISSSGSITYEMIGQLLNAALDNDIKGLDFDTVLSYLTSNGKAFDIKDTDLKGLLEKFGIEDDKQTKIIKDAFNTRINSLVSGYSNLSQQLTSGFSDFSQMQSIVDDLKTAGYDVDFESIFRYSDSLHSWVYTQTGILTRIAQLDTQLESIVDKDSQAYKLLERQRDTLIHQQAQSIDILSVVSATTKEGRDQKRGELLEQVKTYNAVVTDEGKKVTTEQLNAIFNGNVATLKEVYKNLDREVTLDDIRTVANAKYQDLLNAESELDAKVGDIVSERAARIMELSGYAVVDKSTQRVTKIDISKSKQQWLLYQRELYTAGLASLEDLNKSMVEAWGEVYNIGDKSQTLIGALQNANAMSISDLASLVGLSDKQISAAFLSSQVGKGNISRIGGDQIRINNWNNFMQELFTNYDKAFDTTSEAYISAYSEYLDGQIEQQTKVREQATSLISTLESATAGDLINVFQLDQTIGGDKIAAAAQQAGAQFENGIIKTVNSTNMQQLMSNIAKLLFGEGLVNSKELAQIRSKIDTKTTASTAFANIVQNWDNISYEMIETLAEAMQVDILELLELFKSNGHSGYQARGNLGPQDFAAYLGIELDSYSQRIVDNWINTQVENIKTIANSFVSSISNGKQRINVTDENAELVTLLDKEYNEISKDVGGYFIDLTNVEISRALQMLEELGLTGNELNEYRTQVFSAFREKSTSNILSQLISNRDSLDSTLVDKAIADQALGLTQEMFTYNKLTGELSISLANLRVALKNVNKNKVDSKAYNTLLAQLNQEEFDSTTGIYQQIFTSSTISEDLMAKFINAAGKQLQNVDLDQIFRYKDGSYQIKDFSKARELVDTLGLGLDQVIANVFEQRLQGFYQNIGNIGSQMSNGFSNYSDVLAIVNDFNKNFTLDGFSLDANQIATYDEQLHSWVLTQQGISIQIETAKKQLQDSGATQTEIEDALKQTVAQFGESLDFNGYIAATSSTTAEAAQTQANFYQQVMRYNQAITAIYGEAAQEITEEDLTTIIHGGTTAVNKLKEIYDRLHRTLTQEDITTAYQGPMASVIAAKEAMQASVGGIITTVAATLLQTAGYLTAEDLGNGYSIIKSIDQSNAKNAYDLLYNKALTSGVAQQDQLNELILSSWEAADQGESAAIEALGKTVGMSYKEFTDLLLSQGIELGFNTLNDYIASGAIEKIGNGQIRITDINQIVSKKYNSEEYQKAYSEFIDNEIERTSEARENVTNAIDEILNAKTGDQINLNSILSKFGEKTKLALQAIIGSDIENGILTINENSNILQIASAIAEAARAQGTLLEADIIELGDKIREAIQNYIDAITQGITGGISGSQVADIKKFADTYLGEDFFKQSDFIETTKGFQLTSDAAIRYYQALKESGSYDTEDMFKQLQERILNRDNIETMTGIVGHIAELGRQIDAANEAAKSGEKDKADAAKQTVAALQDELNLYKEIAQTSQINNPSSYDFMGKSLPDQFQGPLNYWSSLESMATALKKSSKSGKMGVQDFYNIATELGHLSELTGQELMFYGQSFGKGAEGAAKLIEQGFSNLEQVDGSGAMINLKGIGVNIASGIGGMSDSIDAGIKEMAQSQIKMLDGLIAFLEAIVAMQNLSELDSDFSGSLEINELFTKVGDYYQVSSKEQHAAAQKLADYVNSTDELKKYFQSIKINDQSMYQMIMDMTDPTKQFSEELATLYTSLFNGLYKASLSPDFDTANIPSIISQFLVGVDAKVELEDGTVIYYYNGKTYTGDKNTDFSKLIRQDTIETLGKELTKWNNKDLTEKTDGHYSMHLKNGVELEINVDEKGKIHATYGGKDIEGDSLADIQSQIISQITKEDTSKTSEQAAIELGFKVATNIVWKEGLEETVDQFSEYTRNMIAKEFKGKKNTNEVVTSLQAEWDDDQTAFEAKYGFKFDESLNSDQIHKVLEELVHQQEVELNVAAIPGTDIHIIGPVPVTLKVEDILGMPKELSYIVGGSVGQNSAAYKQYLSSGDTGILAQIMKAGGVTEAHDFLTNTNGYKAAVLKEANITEGQIWEEAKSLVMGDTPMSLMAAFDQAIDNLYNKTISVSKEETGEEKGTTATKNQDTVNQFVNMAAQDAKIYTKELTENTVKQLRQQASEEAALITDANPSAVANEIFDKLIRSALQEKYEKETEEKRKVEEKKTEEALHEVATANFNKLISQTGYDTFIKSPEGRAALTAAGQVAGQAGTNGSTEYIQKWTSEVQSAFDAWSAPENQAKIVAESTSNAATAVETASQTVATAAEKAAGGLEKVADAAENATKDGNDEKEALSQENKNLQAKLSAVQSEVETLTATITNLTTKNELEKAAHEQMVTGLEARITELNNELTLINAQNAELQELNTSLQTDNATLNEQIASLREQLSVAQTLLHKKSDEDQGAYDELIAIREQERAKREERKTFNDEYNEWVPEQLRTSELYQSLLTQWQQLNPEARNNNFWESKEVKDAINGATEAVEESTITISDSTKAEKKTDQEAAKQGVEPSEEIAGLIPQLTQNLFGAFNQSLLTGQELNINNIEPYASNAEELKEAFGGLDGVIAAVVAEASNMNLFSESAEGAGSSASGAASNINNFIKVLNAIPGSKTVNVRVLLNGSEVSGSTSITIGANFAGGGSAKDNKNLMMPQAKGNVALAAGTRTLMGELGPELVVSNGRYFVAGQNGAEFVDLDKDAIVFNHLQTQRLLANGSAGRGTPFTNARNATSMATGNVTGPAKASASAVLSQLKQIRAQWQSIAELSIADLAGKGGGGGGGGNKEIPGFIRDVERWYNWLQKIADLEKQITYQEQLRSKIQSDMVSSGDAYFKSQRKTYQDARDSALTSESLFLSQKEYFNKRRQQLNNSPLSELYTFDESGQLHFQDGSYEWLANLFKTDDYGNLKMSPKQQYQAIIKRNRNFAQYMRYDDSGKKINRKDYKSDDEYYVAMVKAFSDRMDSEKEEMQELFDSWNDQQKAVLEQMQAMNEQLQAMKDNQKEVEEAVIGAIEEMREREIDEMQNTRDALEETNQNFIDGLSDQLNKERQMYQNNQNDQELQRNRRQLAILQRSGASASQIAQMQQKIDKQSQDLYFEKQQEQIDAVKEASDNQIEKLDMQIELAQEQLEFEKAHGLLWGQVYEVMARTPQEITDFIKENTEEFWGKSPLANSEDLDNTLFQATQWVAFRDDVEMQNAAMGRIDQNLDIFMGALEQIYGKQANWDKIKKESEAKYKEYWGIDNEDPNATAWDAYPGKNDDIAAHTTNTMGVDTSATTKSSGSSSSGGKNGKEKTWSYNAVYHYHKNWHDGTWSVADATPHSWKVVNSSSRHTTRKCTVCGATRTDDSTPGAKVDGKQYTEQQVADAQALLNKQTKSTKNAKGGIADYTGWTWIDGTLTEPEGILNAEDYKAWKQDIKTTNLLYNALATVSTAQRNTAAATNSIGSQNAGVNIENAVVNMNTTIANDYDARRAGEQALEQMLTIARKSGTRSAQRR